MAIRVPLDSLLKQGAVFLHHQFIFEDQAKAKFLVYLSSPLHPEPLLVVLSTTDPNRNIPYLHPDKQADIMAITPGELDFFTSDDHTFIDLGNHRFFDKERFKSEYEQGILEYQGRIEEEHLNQLLEKAKNSRILQPDIKRTILGF